MEGKEFIIRIDFRDRLGLGYEILEVLKDKNINLLGMEAKTNHGMVIKFRCLEDEFQHLIDQLDKIDGVLSILNCDHMPYEQREHELTTVLNSVSEGVIAVNKMGEITHMNDVASQILHYSKEKAIGMKIEDLLEAKIPILETLKNGRSYKHKEIKIKKDRRVFHYLTSGVPVINEKNQIMGAVATLKDYKQVEEMILQIDRKKTLTTFDDIIFQSSNMRQIVDTAKMVAKSDSSILLRGESGTGKELFARAIHMESNRSKSPFIAINCAALPENLLESELFGYEEGSFTGAVKGGKKGLFEQADTGTLFLDEIGEISPQIQVRLLRVLQEKAVRRVGGNKEVPVDVRIIAATHQNLEEMISKKLFREDLYYRLNVIPLRIPPLRERPKDIPLIAQHLIQKIGIKLNKLQVYLSKEAIEYMMAQKWPGNVRQLENTLERIINVIPDQEIKLLHFLEWANLEPMKQRIERRIENNDHYFHIKIPIEPQWPSLKDIVREVEKQVVLKVMKTHNSSRKAGRILGVSNTTILNKIKDDEF
ncbi:MAG: sigma 54-interacting transcriptional regulator [Tepidibacillus sp.]